MNQSKIFNNRQSGFVALTTLLVISAVVLAISISVTLIGISNLQNSLDLKRKNELNVISKGCVEEALLQIRNDSAYLGVANFPIGNGFCTISVSGTGLDRTVNIEAKINGIMSYTKRYQVILKTSGKSVSIISYNEV